MDNAGSQQVSPKFQFGLRTFLLFALVAGPITAWLVTLVGGKRGPLHTQPVSGVVVHTSGAPLMNGTVYFYGKGTHAYSSTATTAADGSFKLSTFEEYDGAVPGNYGVQITDANGKAVLTGNATVKKGNNSFRFTVP